MPALLADLAAQRDVELQILVVDGGSTDASVRVAREAGATVIRSVPGRALQMNVGAGQATCDWLCFIHADSRLTHPNQLKEAVAALEAAGASDSAGHFALRFDAREQRGTFLYRYMEAKTATGRRHTINGDQGLLLHRDFFERLRGFDTRLPFLEDQRIAAAIRAQGRWLLLPHRLETSARRFEAEGRRARYLLMALIMAMHLADVSCFFTRARSIYAQQQTTGRLQLLRYVRLLYRMGRDCGLRASAGVAWRIAGIALRESWQPFFAADIAVEPILGRGRRVLTTLHDRLLRPVIVHPPAQVLVGVVLLIVIFGPLQLWCWLRENKMTYDDC